MGGGFNLKNKYFFCWSMHSGKSLELLNSVGPLINYVALKPSFYKKRFIHSNGIERNIFCMPLSDYSFERLTSYEVILIEHFHFFDIEIIKKLLKLDTTIYFAGLDRDSSGEYFENYELIRDVLKSKNLFEKNLKYMFTECETCGSNNGEYTISDLFSRKFAKIGLDEDFENKRFFKVICKKCYEKGKKYSR